ncbi:MAG: hypothetical protein K8I02_03025 [Candidatus Methylomirabilis sp.]|nr:hypothetical protein [Deltaproteobacteria bacterium]
MRAFAFALAAILLAAPAHAGPLFDKAVAYEENWRDFHSPEFGCRVETVWTDETRTTVARYEDLGDAIAWNGTHIVAEAYRYAVTGEADAKAVALRALECQLAVEEITGKPGYLARFVAPYAGPFAAYTGECTPERNCHLVTTGPYAGTFWLGNTSSDMYIGWWYGMEHLWDVLLDAPEDEPVREAVRGAVKRTIDTLMADGYRIVNPDGTVSDAGPEIIGNERLAFHLVAARILGGEYEAMLPQVYADTLLPYIFSTWSPITRWYQYYAFELGFQLQHLLMRLEANPFLLSLHRDLTFRNDYTQIRGTGQAEFDYIAWGEKAAKPDPALVALDKQVLAAIPHPPRLKIHPVQGPWTPDPVIEVINAWGPLIAGLLGTTWDPLPQQALDPFPPEERCVVGSWWTGRPYAICGASDPLHEFSGDDYLHAYWMGRHYGFIAEED